MAGFYDNMAATALRLLTTRGSTMSLTTIGDAARSAKAAMVNVVRHTFPSTGADGTGGVQVGDYEFLVESGATPLIGDRISFNGLSLVVMHVEPIKPADVVVIWKIWGRKG